MTEEPLVTVVIATRDRASYLERLLHCIQQQDLHELECLVLDDGSSPETIAAYNSFWPELDNRFVLQLRAPEDRQPGGPSRMRNRGILRARGKYVAFCDDDDRWVRRDHLSTAVRALENQGGGLFFAAMQTAAHGEVVDPDLYAPARKRLQQHPLAGEPDVFVVDESGIASLLRHRTLHTDTIVANRALLVQAGLYWEKTNLAEDREFSLRLADCAHRMLFRATVVGELDVSHHVSLYRSFAAREKALFANLATLHAELEVKSPALRKLARAIRAWDLLELTRAAMSEGRGKHAREIAMESFFLHPTLSAVKLYAQSALGGRL